MDFFLTRFDGTADVAQIRAGIIADFILGENTAADFRGKQRQRLQCFEEIFEAVRRLVRIFAAALRFDARRIFQKCGGLQKLRDVHGAADFETL